MNTILRCLFGSIALSLVLVFVLPVGILAALFYFIALGFEDRLSYSRLPR